ncbi:hypothetical protein M8C21_028484 [Ambrosia artemisiifolia]|uniref:Uncharacterized protein n=1 Tax=Ambrosia artemisiifolia TaxID=4212 RepID=A0AAD5DCQ1_AMBAR|nr:hypothetical protein M8C21_028484 [Ambrosia artemisiifolia]
MTWVELLSGMLFRTAMASLTMALAFRIST